MSNLYSKQTTVSDSAGLQCAISLFLKSGERVMYGELCFCKILSVSHLIKRVIWSGGLCSRKLCFGGILLILQFLKGIHYPDSSPEVVGQFGLDYFRQKVVSREFSQM